MCKRSIPGLVACRWSGLAPYADGTCPDLTVLSRQTASRLPYTSGMNRFTRFALIWFLALALPVQGYAAQTMLFCGLNHHGSMSEVTAHDHALHGPLTGTYADAVDDQPDSSSGTGEAMQGTCSACASCFTVSAMVAAPLIISEVQLPTTDRRSNLFEPNAGRMVGGLERPPRTFLA